MNSSKFSLKYFLRYVLWYNFKRLIKYPFKIKNQYGYYNAILSYIIQKNKSINLLNLRKRNVYFINAFIILPIFAGVLFSGITMYQHKAKYETYIKRATLPIEGDSYFSKTKNTVSRAYKMVQYQPVSYDEFQYLLYGFLMSLVGAKLLSLNPIFKKSQKIEEILSKIKKVDAEERPWRVIWTPDAIYFESFLGDPDQFVNQKSFWNEINFSPDPPIIDLKDRKKFIVPRKYELPPKIEFKVRADQLYSSEE